jgi:hypothetical protein
MWKSPEPRRDKKMSQEKAVPIWFDNCIWQRHVSETAEKRETTADCIGSNNTTKLVTYMEYMGKEMMAIPL